MMNRLEKTITEHVSKPDATGFFLETSNKRMDVRGPKNDIWNVQFWSDQGFEKYNANTEMLLGRVSMEFASECFTTTRIELY